MENELYVEVIVPIKIDGVFTYSVPEELRKEIEVGKRVLIQFGKYKIYTAIITSIYNKKPNFETKAILDVLDNKPVVTSTQLFFWEWISRYYLCPLGEVMKAALPYSLKLESVSRIVKGKNYENFEPQNEEESILIKLLNEKQKISLLDFQNKVAKKNIRIRLNKWLRNKYIDIEEVVEEKYKPKIVEYVSLAKDIENEEQINLWFKLLEKAPKQSDVLLAFFALNKGNWQNIKPVKKSELLEKANDKSGQALKSLIKKEIFKIHFVQESRIIEENDNNIRHKTDLTPKQNETKESILKLLTEKQVVLFRGVTSSGKTEIYIKIIEEMLKQDRQVLYLMPEIALTSQIVKRLKLALGEKIVVFHSKFSENERTELYLNLLNNTEKARVVVGVRSALFLPFTNLGLIIIDEEHETTYKQNQTKPLFHARDVAIVLAGFFKAKVLLGSATPSIESYYNALIGKYALAELTTRYCDIKLSQIQYINLREERQKKRVHLDYYSYAFIEQLKINYKQKKQTIIFQNRRGYSPYIECDSCGWIPACNQCDVKLTYHKSFQKLICHYCGYSISVPASCLDCGMPELKVRGIGTERIEEDLSLLIPDAKIARMDLDTTQTQNKLDNLLEQIENNEINILVGTQMVTKGLDFEHVELIGIVDADSMLNYPDFRTDERSFQLFAQVAGRAGRREKQGKVIIQSSQLNHPVLKYLSNYDYKRFVEWQLKERKQFNYPPFVRLIKIQIRHKNLTLLNKISNLLANDLKKERNLIVLGPQSPVVSKIKNYYLIDIWLKLKPIFNNLSHRDKLYSTIYNFFSKPDMKNIYWIIDVDPN